MGKFVKGSKPTRAERKAQKKAAREAAKQAEFDLKQQAKEEKRAARSASKSGRSLFGFGRKKHEEEDDGPQDKDFNFDLGGPSRDEDEDLGFGEGPLFGKAPASAREPLDPNRDLRPAAPPAPEPQEQAADVEPIIIDDDIKIIPAKSKQAQELRSQSPEPLRAPPPPQAPPTPQSLASFDISTPEGRAAAKRALEQAEAAGTSGTQGGSPRAPAARDASPGAGTVIRPKSGEPVAPVTPASPGRGTEIRPASGAAPSQNTQDAVAQSFEALRSAVDKDEQARVQPLRRDGVPPPPAPDPDDVLILDNPVTGAPAAAAPFPAPEPPSSGPQSGSAVFPEHWLGLWVAEDGQAIFIEDEMDGWHAVTVLQDPTTKCFYGPDYPEIQTFRMPAIYAQEEIGDFAGERFSVITVPGLPDEHQSPLMFLYFLTSIPASQGGGNRFARDTDPTNRVFLVADFELGTVNPWSDEDDIDWIDPGVNYYKAPGKLDAYMARRMSNEDPLN